MGRFKPATSDGGVSAAVWANGYGHSSLRGRCCWSLLSVPTWEKLRSASWSKKLSQDCFGVGISHWP